MEDHDLEERTSSNNGNEQKKATPKYCIGIGASAGGLEALQEFFQHMPANSGAAFVVVQHLSPDFKSVMDELLGKLTDMPVYNAFHGVQVEKDSIYLNPARKNIAIKNGRLLLNEVVRTENTLNLPIDIFFRSLAEDQKHNAIGAVFSGTGSDGSRGLRAIKEVGGLVIVQDPLSAKFDGMPHSAVNTGVADIVLPPSKIPEAIINYIRHPLINGQTPSLREHISENEQILKDIFKLLKKKSEIDFSHYKSSTVARRIERRMGINQLTTINEYFSLLLENPKELQTLGKDILIGVTHFFRDTKVFEKIKSEVIPQILASKAPLEPIRIWSAGCSSGEEAYSLAIMLDEELKIRGEHRNVKIFATDIDGEAIAEAGTGAYTLDIAEEVNTHRLNTYFVRKDNQYIVKSELRQIVIFAVHNMITDPPFSNIDLALCRNALIYFQQPIQKRVIASIHFSLIKSGYLVLGSAESMGEMASNFDVIDERLRVFQKNNSVRLPVINTQAGSNRVQNAYSVRSELLLPTHKQGERSIALKCVSDSLINTYVPPTIVLDEDLEAVHVYGDVSDFVKKLQPGRVSRKINDLVNDEIKIALSTALVKAQRTHEDILYKGVRIGDAHSERMVNLQVRCINDGTASSPLFFYALIFEDTDKAYKPLQSEELSFDAVQMTQQRISDLEYELQKNQENLQVTIEELETTNEELQAANEELMAANEELQSTNEELQSVNEELFTVNSEYQEKITELTDLNNDMDNVLKSIDIGIIFLDESMLIRNYTPAVRNYINMRESDIGRPFHHISNSLNYTDLLADIAKVFETEQPIERVVENRQRENLALIKIRPYINQTGKSTGTVVSLTDLVSSMVKNFDSVPKPIVRELLNKIGSRVLGHAGARHRVLIVDDNSSDVELVSEYLQEADHTDFVIESASSVTAAYNKLCDGNYDVCLLDYILGAETGIDLLHKMPHLDIPVIVLFGMVDPKLKAEAFSLGVYDCLDKSSLTPQLLERSIEYCVQSRKVRETLEEAEPVG